MASTQSESIVKANSVLGVKVKNKQNENLGEIEEIMIDKQSGQITYVVLSFCGILGMGEKLFALPWRSITYDATDNCFILNIDKDVLKKAPGFDKNNWPDMADPVWKQTIKAYFGDFEPLKSQAKDTIEAMSYKTKAGVANAAEEIQRSGKDWIDYIENHPIQSVLFGLIGYYALKGIIKN